MTCTVLVRLVADLMTGFGCLPYTYIRFSNPPVLLEERVGLQMVVSYGVSPMYTHPLQQPSSAFVGEVGPSDEGEL